MRKKSTLTLLLLPLIIVIFMCCEKAYASDFTRLAGKNRYDTAVAISKSGWTTSDYVIIATGENFPDALSATPLSSFYNAPILLTEMDVLIPETKAELQRLKVKNVFIVGGSGVVSNSVKSAIEALTYTGQTSPIKVTRISGVDRYDTSVEVAKNLGSFSEIVVATGDSFPDALSIAPIAAKKKTPILLVSKDSLPGPVTQFLNGKNINKTYVIGGTGAVSDTIKNKFAKPERISGINRFETNVNVLKRFEGELSFKDTFIATGINFPDALAGSALAAKKSSGIMLTDSTVPAITRNFAFPNMSKVSNLYILGGSGVVSFESTQDLMTSPLAGNTSPNITEGGIAFIRDNYLYLNDENYGYSITKRKLDGTQRQIFYTNKVNSMNVTDKYIFYIDITYGNKIYRMNNDGSGRICINNSDFATRMYTFGNYVYYVNGSDNNRLYRMNLDGSGKTKLSDDNFVQYVNITDTHIYYTENGTEGGGGNLYRINKDGSERTLIRAGRLAFVIVWGDSIFFADQDEKFNISKMNLDGTGYQKLNNDESSSLNILGDVIYYTNVSDGSKLYSIKANGTMRSCVANNAAYYLNIAGDKIYYRDNFLSGMQKTIKALEPTGQADVVQDTSGNLAGNLVNGAFTTTDGKYNYIKNVKNGGIYRYNLDGSGEKFLYSYEGFKQLNVVGDWLYYGNYNNNIYRVKADGSGQRAILTTDEAHWVAVSGDWVYYTSPCYTQEKGNVYAIKKVRTDGTGKQFLDYYDDARSLNIVGDWIYYINIGDNWCIYKIKTDGTGKTKISSTQARSINVIGDTIYFMGYNPNSIIGAMMKMKTDGSNIVDLGVNVDRFVATKDKIYYSTFNEDKLYKMNLDGSSKTFLLDIPEWYTFNILGDTPYGSPNIESME